MNAAPLPLLEREGFFAAVRRFFHAEEVPFGLALVRIVFPWACFCAHLARWPFTRELFSLDGATAPIWNSYGRFHMLPEFSGEAAVALHTALLFFLVTMSLGWCTRFSTLCAAILFTYFNAVDCVSTIAKYSCIGTHTLLILWLSPCGAVWSVDAWLKGTGRRRPDAAPGEPSREWPRCSMWATRLLQLSIGFVYLGAAVTKMKTPTFIGGDQLVSWMLTHVNYEHELGDFMAMNPILLILSAYVTMVWEILFLFTAWRGWGRFFSLSYGLVFHLMTLITLGLTIFPAIVCPIYFAFLREEDFQRMARWVRRFSRSSLGAFRSLRMPEFGRVAAAWRRFALLPSGAAFALMTSAVAAGGLAAEHMLDPYGLRRPEGPYELKELDPEFVNKLFTPAPPVQDKDVFFTMDVGTIVAGGVLLDHRHAFHYGETVTAQCMVVPPHGDIWTECNLHDSEDRLVDRLPLIVMRESTRGNYSYRMVNSLAPGDYYLVLKKGGTEITRRKITLLPGGGDPGAVASPVAQ